MDAKVHEDGHLVFAVEDQDSLAKDAQFSASFIDCILGQAFHQGVVDALADLAQMQVAGQERSLLVHGLTLFSLER